MHWKLSICACQSRDKVIFSCSDGPIRCIDTMNVWGHQVVFNIFLSIIFIQAHLCLIIQHVAPIFRCSNCSVYASSICLPYIILRVSSKIALESYTYITNTYVFPLLEVIGNFSVWSIYILWVFPTLATMGSVCLFFLGLDPCLYASIQYLCWLLLILYAY